MYTNVYTDTANEIRTKFDGYEYCGLATVFWDPSGTKYHCLKRSGESYHYRESDLVIKYWVLTPFGTTSIEEYKNGFEARALTTKDFQMT